MKTTNVILGIVLFLIAIFWSVGFVTAEGEQITGDMIHVTSNGTFITVTPHTLTESGYVDVSFTSDSYTGAVDVCFGFNKLSAEIKSFNYQNSKETYHFDDKVADKPVNKVFNHKHLWYQDSTSITAKKTTNMRVWVDVEFNTTGKYDVIIVPAGMSFTDAKNANLLWICDPWWNATWNKYAYIKIDNTAGDALSYYQLPINVSYTADMQTNFSDIRFIETSDNTAPPYWLEKKIDSDFALFWVNMTSINGGQWDNDTLRMYYDNPSANYIGNITETMIFGDDFPGTSLDLNKWDKLDVTATVADGILTLSTFTGATGRYYPGLLSDKYVGINVTTEWRCKSVFSGDSVWVGLGNGYNLLGGDQSLISYYTSERLYYYTQNNAFPTGTTSAINYWTINTYYVLRNTWFDSIDAKYYMNETLEETHNTNVPDTSLKMHVVGDGNVPATLKIDYCFARKAVKNPPTASVEGEEQLWWIEYTPSVTVENIIAPNSTVWASGTNNTFWVGSGLSSNATIDVFNYDPVALTGEFVVTAGILDSIGVYGFSEGDLVVLNRQGTPIAVAVIDHTGHHVFEQNLIVDSYSITVKSYTDETGVFGFIYEGTTGIDNPLSSVNVYIWNTTWSDTTVSDAGGFYEFTDLTNDTYTLNFKKDRYEDVLYQYVTPELDSMYYKVIYMQKSTGDYYSRHYVTFTLKNLFQARYKNIDSVVYENGNVDATGTTGYDGSVVFHLFEDIEYRVTFINASQSINEEITLYPRDNEYTIYVSIFDFSPENGSIRDTIDYYAVKGEINLTHGWINFTYHDTENETTSLDWWINDSDGNIVNHTYQTYPCPAGAVFNHNVIVNSSNHSYNVHLSAFHPDYPEIAMSWQTWIKFLTGVEIDLGFDEQWNYNVLAVCILIFVSMFFGATNVKIGSLIICLSAWFFVSIGWLGGGAFSYAGLILATILSVFWNLRKGEPASSE